MKSKWNVEDLLHSTRMNKLDEVKSLIEEEDIDVNSADNIGSTALHEAALRGYDTIVKYLLFKGANVDAKTVSDNHEITGATPLAYAVKGGYVSTAKILIEHGAEVNIIINTSILLTVASKRDNPEMINLLLDSGANINDDRGYGDMTPLSVALGQGKYQSARFLLDKGADYKKCCSNQCSPLLYAARMSESSEGVELLLKHVEAKEGKEKLLEYINYNGADNGRTALHVACLKKNYHATKVLLRSGADYKIKDKEGSKPRDLIIGTSHLCNSIRWLFGPYAERDLAISQGK